MGLRGQYRKTLAPKVTRAKIGPMPQVSVLIVSYGTPELTASNAVSALAVEHVRQVICRG